MYRSSVSVGGTRAGASCEPVTDISHKPHTD